MYDLEHRAALARELAAAFLAGPWSAEMLAESGAGCLDRWPGWITGLAFEVVAVHREPPVDRPGDLANLIEKFLARHAAAEGAPEPPQIIRLLGPAPEAATATGPGLRQLVHDWAIAEIASVPALAERLELSDGQLAWLADVRGLERSVTAERLRNYRYCAVPRRSGLARVIEAPKARLKEVQRWVLHEILDRVPAHPAAHGFARGRSVISHAERHVGQASVLRLDLSDFFASIAARRVFGIFHTLGYRRSVAHALTGLCTNAVPPEIWRQIPRSSDPRLTQKQFWLGRQLATPHLPQGAPTSPALANLAAFRLDRRLAGLATSLDLNYSRYADDLTFSGPVRLTRERGRLQGLVSRIAAEEGFSVNPAKSNLSSAATRQVVCGVVVNVRPNVARAEYDALRAILHNAARHGPESQNLTGATDFRAHLRGRISWVASLNPARGEQLRRALDGIDWS